jgi:hypothetical protein
VLLGGFTGPCVRDSLPDATKGAGTRLPRTESWPGVCDQPDGSRYGSIVARSYSRLSNCDSDSSKIARTGSCAAGNHRDPLRRCNSSPRTMRASELSTVAVSSRSKCRRQSRIVKSHTVSYQPRPKRCFVLAQVASAPIPTTRDRERPHNVPCECIYIAHCWGSRTGSVGTVASSVIRPTSGPPSASAAPCTGASTACGPSPEDTSGDAVQAGSGGSAGSQPGLAALGFTTSRWMRFVDSNMSNARATSPVVNVTPSSCNQPLSCLSDS